MARTGPNPATRAPRTTGRANRSEPRPCPNRAQRRAGRRRDRARRRGRAAPTADCAGGQRARARGPASAAAGRTQQGPGCRRAWPVAQRSPSPSS
eukprot:scaffold33523_cov112-Isochrysis_galbana.AAC.12